MIRNQSGQVIGAELVNALTGASFAGAVTVYVTGDAGTQAIGSVGGGVATSEGNGYFTYAPSKAETNYTIIAFTFVGSGAVPATIQVFTSVAGNPVQSTRFNANDVISAAFADIGVKSPGESIPPAEGNQALSRLNNMIARLGLLPSMTPFLRRDVFDVVSGQGDYTIGPGGDFDTVKPTVLNGWSLLQPSQGATVGRNEIPRAMLTREAWEGLHLKDLQSSMWTGVYYENTYTGGLGTIHLWPVPNTTDNALVIYRGDRILGFGDLTTDYDFPEGLFEALEYNLARRLSAVYGGANWTAELAALARTSLSEYKIGNYHFTDLAFDSVMTNGLRGGYNIQTGNL